MGKLKVGTSPLTNQIFCGTVKVNNMWGANKTDVTVDALFAVAEHALRFKKDSGKDVILSNGVKQYTITVIEEDCKILGDAS